MEFKDWKQQHPQHRREPEHRRVDIRLGGTRVDGSEDGLDRLDELQTRGGLTLDSLYMRTPLTKVEGRRIARRVAGEPHVERKLRAHRWRRYAQSTSEAYPSDAGLYRARKAA
jgi:hypothetical protein